MSKVWAAKQNVLINNSASQATTYLALFWNKRISISCKLPLRGGALRHMANWKGSTGAIRMASRR